jgi:hypothetical protein
MFPILSDLSSKMIMPLFFRPPECRQEGRAFFDKFIQDPNFPFPHTMSGIDETTDSSDLEDFTDAMFKDSGNYIILEVEDSTKSSELAMGSSWEPSRIGDSGQENTEPSDSGNCGGFGIDETDTSALNFPEIGVGSNENRSHYGTLAGATSHAKKVGKKKKEGAQTGVGPSQSRIPTKKLKRNSYPDDSMEPIVLDIFNIKSARYLVLFAGKSTR